MKKITIAGIGNETSLYLWDYNEIKHTTICHFKLAGSKKNADKAKTRRQLQDISGIVTLEGYPTIVDTRLFFNNHPYTSLMNTDELKIPLYPRPRASFFSPTHLNSKDSSPKDESCQSPAGETAEDKSTELNVPPHGITLEALIPESEKSSDLWGKTDVDCTFKDERPQRNK